MGEKLNAISLFSGLGGFELGLKEYCQTVLYCESDRHAQAVLLSRMAEGAIDYAPIHTDVRELKGEFIDIPIDIIFGGFPCQDISTARRGRGFGLEGERSGLFFEVVRLADEIKPTFLFLENVSAIRTRGLDRVILEFTEMGYDIRWCMLSASDVGAKHKRERWFCLCRYAKRSRGDSLERIQERETTLARGVSSKLSSKRSMAIPDRTIQIPEARNFIQPDLGGVVDGNSPIVVKSRSEYLIPTYWQDEPEGISRITEDTEQRVERIMRIGNSVVPLQVKTAFEYLFGITKLPKKIIYEYADVEWYRQ